MTTDDLLVLARDEPEDDIYDSTNKILYSNFMIDEDSMATNSPIKLPSQKSVKAYVDSKIGGGDDASYPIGSIGAIASGDGGDGGPANVTLMPNITGGTSGDTAGPGGYNTNEFTDSEGRKFTKYQMGNAHFRAGVITASGFIWIRTE